MAAATCSDQPPVSPRSALAPGQSRLSIAPRFQTPAPGGPTVTLSRLRGVLIGSSGDSVVVEALFKGDSAVLVFTVQFPGNSARYTLKLTGYDKNNVEAYSASQEYTVKPGENTDLPKPELVYTAPDSKLTALRVSPGSLTLDANGSASLSVSGTGANNAPISPILVGWSAKDPSVATVDQNGGVRAGQFQGSTYVVARSYTGVADSALVKVRAPVAKVVLAPSALEIVRGKSGAAAAELRDAGDHLIDDRTATWTSSDPSVATVNASGVIQGLKIGSATITASAEGKSASLAVRVVSPVDRIELTPTSLTFASLRETRPLTARLVARAGASVDGIVPTYESSNAAVASVGASGVVTANQNGSATITVSADGVTATAAVAVKQVAASVSVSPSSAVVNAIGDSRTFSATVADALGNSMPAEGVTWSSSNPSVASVSGGTAVARGAGSVSISATVDGKSDAATFSVNPIPRSLIVSIDRNPVVVGQGDATLTARTLDANGNVIATVPASYSTDTPTLVSVSGNRVTGLANGAARVTGTNGNLSSTVGFLVTGGVAVTLTVSPATAEKLPNGTQQFTVTGGSGPFTWSVNGAAGGNSTYGTITSGGFYTAPASVPSPASFDVCATQASPAGTGCARVAINPVPSAGGEIVVFNDMNLFDNSTGSATGGANQIRFFRNLANFTGSGPRASKTGFEFFRGHNSLCLSDGECTVSANSTMADSLRAAGFTVVDVNDPSATIPSSIDPNIKAILLLNPRVAFSNAEVNSLKQFAAEGGRVIFAGEHGSFYGTYITTVENPFFVAMGAQLTNLATVVNCNFGSWVVPSTSLRTHQITTGLTGLSVPCSSEIQLGPNDFAIAYDVTGTHIIGAVAKVDLTPIPTTSSVRVPPRTIVRNAAPSQDPLPPVDGVNRPRTP